MEESLLAAINVWINDLTHYNFLQLSVKPSPDSWSLGQLYMHLIEATEHYVGQAEICLSNDENLPEEASYAAKKMFLHNSFPDERIPGPASNEYTPEPVSKEQIMAGFVKLKIQIDRLKISIAKNKTGGKTKHPGLNYFNANEWLQFAEMHMRHHLKQRKRIDEFLILNGY
jgi:hypothetical protein